MINQASESVKRFMKWIRSMNHHYNPFHDKYHIYHFEKGKMWIECMNCNYESRGINIGQRINLRIPDPIHTND